jgi:hypothetical protein
MRAPIGPKAKIHENNFVAKKTDSESARRVFSCARRACHARRIALMFFKRCKKHVLIKGFLNFLRQGAMGSFACRLRASGVLQRFQSRRGCRIVPHASTLP